MKNKINFGNERIIPSQTSYPIYQEHYKRYDFASKFVNNKVVLDAACGVAYGSKLLTKGGAKYVVGVDLSMEALEHAKRSFINENISLIIADVHNLPFKSEVFDVIVSFETIEHLRIPSKFLLECYMTLKAQGLLILSTPNKDAFSPLFKKPHNPYHIQEFKAYQIVKMVSEFFQIVSLYYQSYINILKAVAFSMLIKVLTLCRKIEIADKIVNIYHTRLSRYPTFLKQTSVFTSGKYDRLFEVTRYKTNFLNVPKYLIIISRKIKHLTS